MLDTSAQAYSFLRAFELSGNKGLTYNELMEEIVNVGREELKKEIFLNTPQPLITMFEEHQHLKAIKESTEGRFVLTALGRFGLKLLAEKAIYPYQEKMAAAE